MNSPSTTMSLTVSRQPEMDPAERAEREERRRFHLDREDSALRPALVLTLVGVVEEVARDDRAHAQLLVPRLGHVDCFVDELPAGGGAVRLATDEMRRRRVGGDGGERDDHVSERVIRLEAAAGADAQQPLDAELDELFEDDRRRGTAHAGALHGYGLSLPTLPVYPEQPSFRVDLADVGQECLCDVLGPERVAREQARVGVVAGISTQVDGHGRTLRIPLERGAEKPVRTPLEFSGHGDEARRSHARADPRASAPRIRSSASSSRMSPVADSVALWRSPSGEELVALCHVGANAVPSGRGCGGFAREVARAAPRMLIGESRAVSELWAAAQYEAPSTARGPPRPTRLRHHRAPGARARRVFGARRSMTSTSCFPPAPRRTSRSSAWIRCAAMPRVSAGGRGTRSTRGDHGSGSRRT